MGRNGQTYHEVVRHFVTGLEADVQTFISSIALEGV